MEFQIFNYIIVCVLLLIHEDINAINFFSFVCDVNVAICFSDIN